MIKDFNQHHCADVAIPYNFTLFARLTLVRSTFIIPNMSNETLSLNAYVLIVNGPDNVPPVSGK